MTYNNWYDNISVTAGPGACYLRGTERRRDIDPEDHDAHPVAPALRAMSSTADWRVLQGKKKKLLSSSIAVRL